MIEVKHLTKYYGKTEAVVDLSFQVNKGDIFGFIGPNGAGKTTTIKVLATLLDPTEGTALIDGKCVVNRPEDVRKIVGYMPDYYGTYDGITVWEYLDFFAAAYKIDRRNRRRICEDVMALTDLGGLKDKLVSTLSKGMKQRLCLAKTLIHDPKVLVLDEPAAGLDPRARIEIRVLLRELCDMGKTILISSHILAELSEICNSVGIIEKGRLLAYGSVEEITRKLSPSRVIAVKVLSDIEKARNILASHPQTLGIEIENNTVKVTFDGERNDIYKLVKALTDNNIPIVELAEEKQDLESLFMEITNGEVA